MLTSGACSGFLTTGNFPCRRAMTRMLQELEFRMSDDWEYVGFWARTAAGIVDLILQMIITVPLTVAVYGQFMSPDGRMFRGTADFLINAALPAVAVIGCWLWWGATPGKLAMSAKVVDADTGDALRSGQAALRYFGYIVSALPIGVGFLWVGLDR